MNVQILIFSNDGYWKGIKRYQTWNNVIENVELGFDITGFISLGKTNRPIF